MQSNQLPEQKQDNVLVLLVGLPGTGKTTYCRALARRTPNGIYLEKDVFCDVLLDGKEYFGKYYNEFVKPKSYQLLLALARQNLKLNKIVFPDSYFGDKLTGDLLKDFLVSPDFKTVVIYLHCSGKKQLKRLTDRNAIERDADKIKNFETHRVEHILAHLKQLAQIPEEDFLIIDTEDDNFEPNIKKIEHFIHTSKGISKIIPLDKEFKMTVEDAMLDVEGFKSLLTNIKLLPTPTETNQNHLGLLGVFASKNTASTANLALKLHLDLF
ncbi:MAG TPA: AAA family ATPase [Gammaproteobacteria bacterium]|nr:AAA family ATPase [Gammaproteobacteria bacterium]